MLQTFSSDGRLSFSTRFGAWHWFGIAVSLTDHGKSLRRWASCIVGGAASPCAAGHTSLVLHFMSTHSQFLYFCSQEKQVRCAS